MRHPAILNLHFRLWESYISVWMSGRHQSAEGRSTVADTHLALLGVKIAGTGILGCTKDFTKEFLRKPFTEEEFVKYTRDSNTQEGSCLGPLKQLLSLPGRVQWFCTFY